MNATASDQLTIRPQPGPQELFLSLMCDIIVYGGSAGGGKSYGLLLDALRYAALESVSGYGAVIFRRESPQITNQGGLWDEASALYPLAGGKPNKTFLSYEWPQHKTRVRFSHMQYEDDKLSWQGAQIPYIGWDELTHFSESQFFYMLSRNRSTCGVKPRMRATCNADPYSWVKVFLAPWLDKKYSQPAKSGEIRYFYRDGQAIVWLLPGEKAPPEKTMFVKSCTFIRATAHDNKKLLEKDPGYLANLDALPLVDRLRLRDGDWDTILTSGQYYQRRWFPKLSAIPPDIESECRFWDKAASAEPTPGSKKSDPDYTASVLLGRRKASSSPRYVILDATWGRKTPAGVETLIKQTATLDDGCTVDGQGNILKHEKYVRVVIEEEGGSSGKDDIFNFVSKVLDGFNAHGKKSTGNKEVRAKAPSAQAEVGNIGYIDAPWNEEFFKSLEAFPNPKVHDDLVDGLSGAYGELAMAHIPLADEDTPTEQKQPDLIQTITEYQRDPWAYAESLGLFND